MEKLKFNEWLEKYYNKKPYELNDYELKLKHYEYMEYKNPSEDYQYSGYPWLKDCPELVEHSDGVYVLKRGNDMKKDSKIEDKTPERFNAEGFNIVENDDWDKKDLWAYEIQAKAMNPEWGEDRICILVDLSDCEQFLEWELVGLENELVLSFNESDFDVIDISFRGAFTDDEYTREQVLSMLGITNAQLDNIIDKCKKEAAELYAQEKQEEYENEDDDDHKFTYYNPYIKHVYDSIKQESDGYVIYSENGKKLSKPYKTKEEAEKRLKEIEMFKHMKKDSKAISKSLIEDKIRKVLKDFLIKEEGYTERDVDDYVVIEFSDFTDEDGYKGIKIEIRNDLVGYYELPDEVASKLDKVVSQYNEDSYFEPYDAYVWDAYIWDREITDSMAAPYYYLFPADLSKKDLDVLPKYNLKFVGEMSEESEDKGSKVVKGSKVDLERYAKEYLSDYSLAEDYLYPEADLDIELIKDINIKDRWIENNDIRETLDKYLNWEGIFGYTDDILEVWENKEAIIDGEYKQFETPEEALEAYLEWEGIIGYDETIKDILEGGDAYLDDDEDDDLVTDSSKYHNGIEIIETENGYQFALDDEVKEVDTLEEAYSEIDDYLYPDRHKENSSKIKKEKYIVYDPDTMNYKTKRAMYWSRDNGGRYMEEKEADRFTKEEAEKIEKFKGEHIWVKKLVKDEKVRTPRGEFDLVDMTEEELRQQGFGLHHIDGDIKVFTKNNRAVAIRTNDSVDLMELLNKCKDIIKQHKADKDFTISHKKEGEQDKLILNASIDFEDTELEEELIEKLTECIEEFYSNSEFKYNDRTAGGTWLLKE